MPKNPLNEFNELNNPRYNKALGVYDLRKNRTQGNFKHLPPGMSPQGYIDFVNERWNLYSAFSYDSFLSQGKGILFVDWDNTFISFSSEKITGYLPENDLPAIWFTKSLVKSLVDKEFCNQKWLELINNYDPEISINLALNWRSTNGDGFGTTTIRTIAFPGQDTPKISYLKMKDRLAEFVYIFNNK